MKHQTTQNTQSPMQATLYWGAREQAFKTDEVVTQVNFGSRSFFGIQYTEGSDTAFSAITLTIPEHLMVEGATLTIGAGEKAEISAYFSSTSIGRSGWAIGGEIHISQMDETSKAFSATFHYTIEHTMGHVEIANGSLSLSLADHARRSSGLVQAKVDPSLVPSLGNLDAHTIAFKDLEDGRIRLHAIQHVGQDSQGILMLFNEQHARLFYLVDIGVHDMVGGSLEYQWNAQERTLTATFTDYVVSYQGKEHRITDGSIEVSLA
ncbi:hypothetical protein C6A77_14375 [Pseudomonas sp. AFG_SD02_1510_Pfu_092]|uniref:hypothetical protein n=1 Tax=Pseudomonas sp. AFG_SD02_1510_Pfu_092 TaxID=2259497 RepID=UPI000DEF04A4|nr:hypothetical protein [Pseudomonas sp. AFG_SD02_1510_Pfu_092]RCL25201.1 hypothetical protein C6A77_14375 [Pseudomonas sp. AFG_SD02_1510_Pfu_092]